MLSTNGECLLAGFHAEFQTPERVLLQFVFGLSHLSDTFQISLNGVYIEIAFKTRDLSVKQVVKQRG